MRHFGGAVVLLLGRTALDPWVPYGKLIHGGSILVVTYTGKANNIGRVSNSTTAFKPWPKTLVAHH